MTPAPFASLPPPLREFIDLFNGGQYFESHEVLEHAWLKNRSDFYQGLIIYAAAYVKRDRDSPRGIWLNMGKSLNYLRPYPGAYLGLRVDFLKNHGENARRRLEAIGVPRVLPRRDLHRILPTITLVPEDNLIRGDEVELGSASAPPAADHRPGHG